MILIFHCLTLSLIEKKHKCLSYWGPLVGDMDLFDSSSAATVGESTLDLSMHSRLTGTRSSGLNHQSEECYDNVKQQLLVFNMHYNVINSYSQNTKSRHE